MLVLHQRIGEWLGVRAPNTDQQMLELVERQIPTSSINRLLALGLTRTEIDSLVIPLRTLQRRRERREPDRRRNAGANRPRYVRLIWNFAHQPTSQRRGKVESYILHSVHVWCCCSSALRRCCTPRAAPSARPSNQASSIGQCATAHFCRTASIRTKRVSTRCSITCTGSA